MKSINAQVKAFKRKYRIIGVPSLNKLKNIISKLSYTLVTYQGNEHLLDELLDTNNAGCKKAITVTKGNKRCVFYNLEISKTDLPYILAHEIGHIYLNHLKKRETPYDTTEQKEQQAHIFASLLMTKHTDAAAYVLFIGLIISLILNISFLKSNSQPIENINTTAVEESSDYLAGELSQNEVIITSAGKKYHLANCGHIKNRKVLKTITIKEVTEQGYTPCLDCIE